MRQSGYIFISYSRWDGRKSSSQLMQALAENGYTTWRDERRISPDEDYSIAIEQAIDQATHCVICITSDSNNDDLFNLREIQYALATKKPLVVARMENVKPPAHLTHNVWLNFYDDWQSSFDLLISILQTPPAEYQAPGLTVALRDPFRSYIESLYRRIVKYMQAHSILLDDESDNPMSLELQFEGFTGVATAQTPHSGTRFSDVVARCGGHVLLAGEPGTGKSITLLSYARDATARRLGDVSQPLPLFKSIASWDAANHPRFIEWLTLHNEGISAGTLQQIIKQGEALVILDGLKSLPEEAWLDDDTKIHPRQKFIEELARIFGTGRTVAMPNQIIISGDLHDYPAILEQTGFTGVAILYELNDTQIDTYLKNHSRLSEILQSDDNLRELLRFPILLNLFGRTLHRWHDHLQDLANMPPSSVTYALFNAYVADIYQKNAGDTPITLDKICSVLGYAALHNATTHACVTANVFTYDELVGALKSNPEDFVELVVQLKIIARNPDDTYGFIHTMLRDTFAANFNGSCKYPMNLFTSSETLEQFDESEIQAYIVALKHNDPEIQQHAASKLREIGMPEALEAVEQWESASSIHTDSPPSSKDDGDDVSAVVRLGRQGEPRAIESLIEALYESQDMFVINSATRSLVQIGEPAVDYLLKALESPEPNVRAFVADVLGEIGSRRAILPLQRILVDSNLMVGFAAACALGAMGDIKPLTSMLMITEEISFGTSHGRICDGAARALEALGTPAAMKALKDWYFTPVDKVTRLAEDLKHKDPAVRERSVEALGEMDDPSVIPHLIDALSDKHPSVRSEAAYILGEWGESGTIKALADLLNDTELDSAGDRVCNVAAAALEKIGTSQARSILKRWQAEQDRLPSELEKLIDQLGDSSPHVRYDAIIKLGESNDKRVTKSLIHMLRDDASPMVRGCAANALGRLKDPRAVEVLIAALRDEEPIGLGKRVCDRAVVSLALIYTPEAKNAIIQWYDHQAEP